jgi:hypothetical protein
MRQRISDVNQKTGYPVRHILSIACGTRMNSGDREKVRPYLAMRKEKGKLPQRRGGAEDDRERNLIEAAIAVHRKLGPGLLETVYGEQPLRPCASAGDVAARLAQPGRFACVFRFLSIISGAAGRRRPASRIPCDFRRGGTPNATNFLIGQLRLFSVYLVGNDRLAQ